MSSLAKRYRRGGARLPDPGELLPPDLRKISVAPFGDEQRARLTAWLREAGWQREHMQIAALEGYLVALIAWPVGVPTGAWLPPIWGERGWKVPMKIAARSQYEEFVALVVGFMRALDRSLTQQPSRFDSSVLRGLNERARVPGLQAWGKGFMTGLTLGSQGFKGRSGSACAAVRDIAANTSASVPLGPQAIEEVVNGVFALMAQRGSRGPLGLHEESALPGVPVARPTNTGPGASSRNAGLRST
jgi:yecA family protein